MSRLIHHPGSASSPFGGDFTLPLSGTRLSWGSGGSKGAVFTAQGGLRIDLAGLPAYDSVRSSEIIPVPEGSALQEIESYGKSCGWIR